MSEENQGTAADDTNAGAGDESQAATGDAGTDTGGSTGDGDSGASGSAGEQGDQGEGAGQGEGDGDGGAGGFEASGYTFQAPEGMEIDEAMMGAIAPIMRELGVTQEGADKLVAAYAGQVQAAAQAGQESMQTAFSQQISDWETELQNDETIGGENFQQNIGAVKDFIDKTAPPEVLEELRGMFDMTGVGSHPALVRYFHALSQKFPVGEDGAGGPGAGTGAARQMSDQERRNTRHERLYGNK